MMKQLFLFAILLVGSSFLAPSSSAAIIQFDLLGFGGAGLLPSNERPTAASGTGSGGEIGPNGILFDDMAKILSVNVGWGSGNGYTDLTGTVNAGHIHTAGTGGGILAAGAVLIGFNLNPGVSDRPEDGFVQQNFVLDAAQETLLFNGDLYLNFHTLDNRGGEIRGNLVQAVAVPEPSSVIACAVISAGGVILVRRRRASTRTVSQR